MPPRLINYFRVYWRVNTAVWHSAKTLLSLKGEIVCVRESERVCVCVCVFVCETRRQKARVSENAFFSLSVECSVDWWAGQPCCYLCQYLYFSLSLSLSLLPSPFLSHSKPTGSLATASQFNVQQAQGVVQMNTKIFPCYRVVSSPELKPAPELWNKSCTDNISHHWN